MAWEPLSPFFHCGLGGDVTKIMVTMLGQTAY